MGEKIKYKMINYILFPDEILEVRLSDPVVVKQRMSTKQRVIANDIIDKTKQYQAQIEFLHDAEMAATPDKTKQHAIFLHFKQLYTAGSLKLNDPGNHIITGDLFASLFRPSPSPIELQNQLISLLHGVYRIKPDIMCTIEDLIVSTGYTQKDLKNALHYLKEIRIITEIGSFDEYNQPLEENFLNEKYSVERKILKEHEKLKSTPEKISATNKFFRKIKIEPNSKFCFVIMPFKQKEFPQEWYKKILKPFIEQEFNIDCLRVDDDMLPYKIDDKIYTYISEAKFILAEISSLNPNVMYELGMAHMLNKDVILLTKEDLKKIPFDINKILVYKYEDERNLKDILRKAIPKLIQQ